MVHTQILPEHPGYTWVWDSPAQFPRLHWAPIPGIYSPPSLHQGIQCFFKGIPRHLSHVMGRVIGKDGRFIKEITHRSQTYYIFFRNDGFEVWGYGPSCVHALHLLERHLAYHTNRLFLSKNETGGIWSGCLQKLSFEPVGVGPVV